MNLMKMKCLCLLMMPLTIIVTPLVRASTTTETLVWNRAPLRILLPVNEERRMDFPVEVVAYVPDTLDGKLVATATLEGSVFWRANATFDTTRLIVTDKSGHIQWLLDVSADPKAPRHTLAIQDSRVAGQDASPQSTSSASMTTDSPLSLLDPLQTVVDEVDLIQIAARQFYGPSRLAALPPGVTGARVTDDPVDIYRGGGLTSVIKGQWRATTPWEGALYVTAVMVTNQSPQEVRPDPRRVKGRLSAIAMQHAWLAPAGQFPHDTTIWYLVSDQPLREALMP